MKSIDEDTHKVGSCERMNPGSKLGWDCHMAVPVGEARFVHFKEPGTTLQPGEWTGPIHVMVVEHRDDETSLIVRPFLDYNEATEEDGDKPEDLRKIPTRKLRAGKHYYEPIT